MNVLRNHKRSYSKRQTVANSRKIVNTKNQDMKTHIKEEKMHKKRKGGQDGVQINMRWALNTLERGQPPHQQPGSTFSDYFHSSVQHNHEKRYRENYLSLKNSSFAFRFSRGQLYRSRLDESILQLKSGLIIGCAAEPLY